MVATAGATRSDLEPIVALAYAPLLVSAALHSPHLGVLLAIAAVTVHAWVSSPRTPHPRAPRPLAASRQQRERAADDWVMVALAYAPLVVAAVTGTLTRGQDKGHAAGAGAVAAAATAVKTP